MDKENRKARQLKNWDDIAMCHLNKKQEMEPKEFWTHAFNS